MLPFLWEVVTVTISCPVPLNSSISTCDTLFSTVVFIEQDQIHFVLKAVTLLIPMRTQRRGTYTKGRSHRLKSCIDAAALVSALYNLF